MEELFNTEHSPNKLLPPSIDQGKRVVFLIRMRQLHFETSLEILLTCLVIGKFAGFPLQFHNQHTRITQ